MRLPSAARIATGAALLSLSVGCTSADTEDRDPAPSPTAEAAGWPVYDGPAAPDLVLREVPLDAGVGRGVEDVDRVERIGGVAVLAGHNDRHDLTRAVDLASGRVLWQRRSGDSIASPLGEVRIDGPWAAVPASGALVGKSSLDGCERNSKACGIDPRLEEHGQALHAVDARTGTVRWSVPLLPAAPASELAPRLPFGVDEIEVAGDTVVVNLVDARGEDALIQGYDAATGKRLWERSGAWVTRATDGLVLAQAIDDPDDEATAGALQGRDARTGKVLWTNPELPVGPLIRLSGSAEDGIGHSGDRFFGLDDGEEITGSTGHALVATGAEGSYGVSDGPRLEEGRCCLSTVATVGPDGVWRRSERAVGEGVEWADGDYIWRSIDDGGQRLIAVDRTGTARSREVSVTYGALFAPGLILSDDVGGGIRMWTYRSG
ncbi:outer membrane protein assembly factor BamB family protein [Nocardioides sp. GXZ039]|uniref:outer membrane protein assembly factor BamB family protein n=1 Tax=Nocardioides sp. GXZ039 TaxID=3136018 RepID=UPI0030F486A5